MQRKKKASHQVFTILRDWRQFLKTDLRYDLNLLPRPFFLEIDGVTSGGKSTVIRELDKFFRRQNFRVFKPMEGPEAIRHIPRTTPEYNLRTGLYSLQMLMDFSWGHLYDMVIFERGTFDPVSWMEYWRGKDRLTEEEKTTIQEFFLLDFFTQKIDAAFFLVCDPQVAFERETRFELSTKVGTSTNPTAIKASVERYQALYNRLKPLYPQLILVDTTNLSEVEMTKQVTGVVLDLLEERVLGTKK